MIFIPFLQNFWYILPSHSQILSESFVCCLLSVVCICYSSDGFTNEKSELELELEEELELELIVLLGTGAS